MSEKKLNETLPSTFIDEGCAGFQVAWLARDRSDPPPDWRYYLPTSFEPCSPDLIRTLIKVDIECRVKSGLPALLMERYFEHPRLQQADAYLDARQQIELIQWEYEQRWQHGQQARRADYQDAFPHHAESLRQLKARSRCPKCQQIVSLEETCQSLVCPACGGGSSLLDTSPPTVAEAKANAAKPTELDLRNYELIEPLGQGGMGEVYRCCDPALSRDLAIKVMKPEFHNHPAVERRFLREARITGSLQHPGIIAVHNLGRLADGRLFYTMRLLRDGRTLADILKEEAGKPERLTSLLAIFAKVCEGVAYAHSKRVIHRDLKPANIMVGKFGEVQVMDWGLAKLLTPEGELADERPQPEAGSTLIHTEAADTPSDLTQAGSGIGTPAYMPPEQAQGDWELVDERADVFALGAILCVILTGRPPYSGENGNELLRRARRGDVAEALARLEQCGADAALRELCRECLSVERQQRPRDAGMVALRVADYQAEVEARLRQAELERTEAEVKSREERKRRRLALSLSAAVLLVFLAGTLISTLFALDAHRQADAARKHAEDAENEKLRADGNARQAEAEKQLALQARDDEELALIEGLLLPIGRTLGRLSETEVDAFTTLHGLRSDHARLRFLEEGLRTAERAQRLALRAEWVIQAGIGLDEGRRQKAKDMLIRRLRQREGPQEVQSACAMLGIALDVHDPLIDEQAGEIILALVTRCSESKSGIFYSDLPQLLEPVSKRLDAAAAAKAADTLAAVMSKTTDGSALFSLSYGLQAVSGHLDAAAAAKVADTLLVAMSKTTDGNALYYLSDGLQAVSGHLDSAAAAAHAAKAADTLLAAMSKTTDRNALHYLSGGLQAVSGYLDAAAAAKAADTLAAVMSKTTDGSALYHLSYGLQAVSGHLDSAAAAAHAAKAVKAADTLLDAMSNTTDVNALRSLSYGLQAVSGYLDAAAAAKAADTLLAAMSKTTDVYVLSVLSVGLQAVSRQLDAATAAAHAAKAADTLLAAMSKTTAPSQLFALLWGLQAVEGQLDASRAARFFATMSQDVTLFFSFTPADLMSQRWSTPEVLTLLRHPLAAGPIQRALLDVLGHRTRRHFRNTWHFLDWARSNGVDFVPPSDARASKFVVER